MKEVEKKKHRADQENGGTAEEEISNLTGDYANVAVLLFLYLLQGNDSDKIFEIS
jgi:hypothetical protein